MANEISFNASLTASKNGASVTGSASKILDMAGTEMISSVQQFTTSPAQISLGGCDSVGALLVLNLDPTNDLTIGLNTPITQVVAVLKPGAMFLSEGISATLYAQSSASTVEGFVVCAEA